MSSSSLARTRGLGRVVVYYAVLFIALGLAVRNIPVMADVVSGARLSELEGSLSGALTGTAPVGQPVGAGGIGGPGGPWASAIIAGLSMAGALLIMVPVTWVYMVTRRHRGYEESVVHTLLILPVAVTGIVMIVQNSIALAFSLAGIVAAVRFRTTLDDTKDAVYVFLAIGVGLATGVQALGIALTLSVVFNSVVVVLWLTHFGNIYADQNTRSGPLAVGDVLAGPGSAQTALKVGDPSILEATAPSDLAEIAERAVRIERHVTEERMKKKERRANALMIVVGPSAEAIQTELDPLLEERSVRWKLAEIGEHEAGTELIYLARLDGPADKGAIMDHVRSMPSVVAAELRSLQGIKPRS